MMEITSAILAVVVLALVGWGIAELKAKMTFTRSEEDLAEVKLLEDEKAENNFKEMTIYESQKKNSIKGYQSV
jgi:hypothetical protein